MTLLHPRIPAMTDLADSDKDLAAELRIMIYTFHLQDLDTQSAELPITPPLTQVSRQLRSESLPLFYSTCSLSLNRSMSFGPTKPFPPTAATHLASFQNFSTYFNTVHPGFGARPIISHITHLKLEMPPGRIRSTVSVGKCLDPHGLYRTDLQVYEVLENLMDGLLALLKSRKTSVVSPVDGEQTWLHGLELRKGDFRALRILFRDA